MTQLAQGLFGIHKYPHTDKDQAAYLAMKTLARILRGEVEVETVVERPVVCRRIRVTYKDHPMHLLLASLGGFMVGILLGCLI